MAGRYGDIDYATLTKRCFLLGLGLFVIGALGGTAAGATGGQVPAWEQTLFFDLELVGLLIAFVSPFLFGIVLPLTE
jgi:hypothetical protein